MGVGRRAMWGRGQQLCLACPLQCLLLLSSVSGSWVRCCGTLGANPITDCRANSRLAVSWTPLLPKFLTLDSGCCVHRCSAKSGSAPKDSDQIVSLTVYTLILSYSPLPN